MGMTRVMCSILTFDTHNHISQMAEARVTKLCALAEQVKC